VGGGEAEGELEFTMPQRQTARPDWCGKRFTGSGSPCPYARGAPVVTVTRSWREKKTPPVGEEPIEWKLLTNRTAETLEDIVQLIDWYRRRWLIEILFRIWKSGCKIESLQLGSMERLERALVIYLIIAWRILSLVTWGRDWGANESVGRVPL
jgi:hypothetical protein